MPCYSPLTAYRSSELNPSGKRSLVFSPESPDGLKAYVDLPMVVIPCGQCIGCRLERSRRWAARCLHESQLHENNCFITLTFDDNLLPSLSLRTEDFQKFMKRLRKHVSPKKVRFFHCGEYGETTFRPHHHAIIFGFDFDDKVLYKISKNGDKYYNSPTLDKIWGFGFAVIGAVTFESAAYVARYCVKKVTGKNAADYYGDLKPPYNTMSRRPGIGSDWIKKYSKDVYNYDHLVIDGVETRPLPYYDDIYKDINPQHYEEIKQKRLYKTIENENNIEKTGYRLYQKHEVKQAQIKTFTSRNNI